MSGIKDAYVLLNLGDSVTTDHISPAGSIARTSCAAKYLTSRQYVFLFHASENYIYCILIYLLTVLLKFAGSLTVPLAL